MGNVCGNVKKKKKQVCKQGQLDSNSKNNTQTQIFKLREIAFSLAYLLKTNIDWFTAAKAEEPLL